ncbi:zinc finger protein 714 isoform X2 [Amyelois transitella]|uniref:zinc finger protein 714 isoform X2 n=1 Tax=Amyelois transitella TaxID=680683 RepID=UPI0029904DA1|nr:zinc finger protein 714 isoform X2 [Amyelois transitella]
MAVYLTRNMLDKMNKIDYGSQPSNVDTNSPDWQKIFRESKMGKLSSDKICRVCAKVGSTPLSQKIDGYDIMSAICSITNVTINVQDSLPKFICTECLETLKIAVAFKKNCEASDRKFKKILNPMGDPSFHSYPYSKHDFQLILHQMKLKRLRCEEKLQRERVKKEKLKEKKEVKTKQFKCSPCDMDFPNKDALMEHRRERQCMRRACELCGQLVLSIAQHMRHMHKENVLHKCPTCGKEFPIVARLKNHMLVHTDTFNFFCDLCPYKCKHKYYLVMHMRTHTGEKPYKCPQCQATFVNPSNLNKHKLTHQEKQFKCMLCEKAFRTNTALREHQEATHMNIKHKCVYCGRDFCYKSDLRKHEIKNHNRLKRDYIGGEPSYKQVERLQKLQECTDDSEKWRVQQVTVTQPVPVACTTYIDQGKEYIQTNHPMYFTDVTGMIQQQPQIVQQQTVQLTLPELELKKYDVKMYEPQQGIGYF